MCPTQCYDGSVNKKTVIKSVFFAFAGVLLLIAGVAFVAWVVGTSFYDAVNILQSAVTVLAIGFGGAFALYKLEVFRELRPHLRIDESITHRSIGPNYTHIAVTTNLHNTSKVAVEIREAGFRVQIVAPVADSEVKRVLDDYSQNEDDENYMQWPMYSETLNRWPEGDFVIEPNGIDREVVEFVVPSWIKTVLVYAYFSRVETPDDGRIRSNDQAVDENGDGSSDELWQVAVVYDLS